MRKIEIFFFFCIILKNRWCHGMDILGAEAFHAWTPLSVKSVKSFFMATSPLVSSPFGRRRVGLWPTKPLVAREKNPLVPRVCSGMSFLRNEEEKE